MAQQRAVSWLLPLMSLTWDFVTWVQEKDFMLLLKVYLQLFTLVVTNLPEQKFYLLLPVLPAVHLERGKPWSGRELKYSARLLVPTQDLQEVSASSSKVYVEA